MISSPTSFSANRLFQELATLGSFTLAYLIALFVGNLSKFGAEHMAVIWPASGVFLAALLLSPYHRWLVLIPAALFSQLFFELIVNQQPLGISLIISCDSLFEATVGAWLVRLFWGPKNNIWDIRYLTALVVIAGLLVTALGSLISAMGFVAASADASYWHIWQLRWLADAVGVLIISPLVLLIYEMKSGKLAIDFRSRWVELVLMFGSLFVSAIYIFSGASGIAHWLFYFPYMIVPSLIWAAFRFEPIIASLSIALTTLIAVEYARRGHGPFTFFSDSVYQQTLALQGFLTVFAGSIILLATLVTKHRRSEEELLRATEARRTAMESIHERYWRFDKDLNLVVWNVGSGGPDDMTGNEHVGQSLLEYLEFWTAKGWYGHRDPKEIAQLRYQQYKDGSIPRYEQKQTIEGRTIEIRRYRSPDGGYTETQDDISDLIQLEQSARNNEALFKAFLANTPNFLTIKDLEGRYIHVSHEFYRLYNLEESAVIGHFPHEVLPDDIARNVEQGDLAILENQDIWSGEIIADTPRGRKSFMAVRFPVTNNDGEKIGIGGIATDITEMKQQQESLQASEELHRVTLEAVGSGGWDYDLVRGEVVFSDRLLEFLGYEPVNITVTAQMAEARIHPDDLLQMRNALTSHLKEESKFYESEQRVRHKKGHYIWMMMRGAAMSRDKEGRVLRIVGANFDIDDRKRAEQDLMQSELQFRELVEGSIQGIYIHNQDSTLFANRACAEIFGFRTPEQILALKSRFSLYAPHEHDRLKQYGQQRLRGENPPEQYQFDGVKKDGSIIHLSTVARQITWKGENALQVVVVDITEQYRAVESTRVSEQRHKRLFESAPVALFESDWSKGMALLDQLRGQGVTDILGHLKKHPDLIRYRRDMGELTNVNQEALRIYQADSKPQLIDWIQNARIDDLPAGLIERMANHEAGQRRNTQESISLRTTGEAFPAMVTSENISEDPEDWSQMLTMELDLSAQKAAETSLRTSEEHYRRLFETAPVSLWEQDWSGIKQLVDRLRADGIDDVIDHLNKNPRIINRRADVSSLIDVNAETLRLYDANDKQQFIDTVQSALWEERNSGLLQRIEGFLAGNRRVILESEGTKMDGSKFPIRITTELANDDMQDWSRIYTSDQDITEEVLSTTRLSAYRDELRSLAGKMSLAGESERRRISSDLHDGTIQNLVLARMKLSTLRKALRSEKSLVLADGIKELVDSSLAEARTMIFDLSPPVLYELGLETSIDWLGDQFRERTGVSVEFNSDGQPAELTEELKIVLFQAVRELLVNVAKHAQAKQVKVEWVRNSNELEITVEDDGVGFDITDAGKLSAADGGFGLFSIRERLGLLGANFTVQSSASGTRVTVIAPVNKT